jgi:hypothetical protein
LFKRVVSFFKENTLKALFEAFIGIVLVTAFSLFKSVRASVFNFFLFIIRKEYFYICLVFAGVCMLLYRRIRNLEKGLSKVASDLDDKAAPLRGFEYFFSENANWKIDLVRRAFDKNPHCVCCEPPSILLALGAGFTAFDFFGTSDTHRCPKTDKKYFVKDDAYLVAYQRAKKEYEVINPDLEEELKKIKSKRLKPAKEKLNRHEEVIFILNELAGLDDKKLHKNKLRKKYLDAFRNKKQADFNIVWNDLETKGLIGQDTHGYDDRHFITQEGLEYLGRYK